MLDWVSGEVTERSEIGPLEIFSIVIETAELPLNFAAVTVTCDTTTPSPCDVADEGVASASEGALQIPIVATKVRNFLTSEFYQS
jgi:hypothetical protein